MDHFYIKIYLKLCARMLEVLYIIDINLTVYLHQIIETF